MLKALKYHEGIKLYDIIEIDYVKYVVISISYEEITCEPLDRWIMRNSVIMYDGMYMSVLELINEKANKFLADRDKGMRAECNPDTFQYEVQNVW